MFEFVDFGLNFGSNEKVMDSAGQKSTDPHFCLDIWYYLVLYKRSQKLYPPTLLRVKSHPDIKISINVHLHQILFT